MSRPDLVVIGGGIAGSSAAYHAVRLGADVVMIDAGFPGGASGAGAGIISPVGLDRGEVRADWTALVSECVGHYRALLAELEEIRHWPGQPLFRTVGEILVAADEEDRDWLQVIADRLRSAEGMRRHGLTQSVSPLAAGELTRFWPELRSDLTGLFIPEVGRVEGDRLTARLRAAADASVRQGSGSFSCVDGEAVLDLEGATPRVRLGDRLFEPSAVLLTAGSWIGGDPRELGLAGTIEPVKGQIIHLRVPGEQTTTRPVINTRGGGYLLGFDDRVVVGASHERVGFMPEVTAGGQALVLQRALALAPGLQEAPMIETRVGFRPTSSDGLPMLGATHAQGVFILNGLGSWGLTLGPYLGGIAARHALGGPLDERFGFLAADRAIAP